ncbi:hypothetical protein F9L16_23660 [Agarivorans sp. B2Z047]|uniref:phage neck terminator protein n=1 Tax=Agarivorans sp. B2Z047 TaxID=2652721 RepID=UPI00128B6BD8|nr:hypothetical protein [Agarivorans sp. B2Z047]MPW31955.1 hypothetical protein [Agarivorans sp. B2Z047]UQN41880.1 hypothetical protein LQZ07_19190 [Agarivorans sp. B2Z047]UQN44887.1 hypothetical protein LQZ07_10605 [Agarivorans sp. B2Z047]
MSTTLDELEKALHDWLALVTSRVIVAAGYDEQPRPKDPYCSFQITDTKPLDHPVTTLSEDGLTESIYQQHSVQVTLEVIGGNSNQVINRILSSTWSAGRSFDLWKLCGLGGFTEPNNLTALEVGTLRQRWQSKLTLHTTLRENFTGEYQNTFNLSINETDKGEVYNKDQPVDSNC